MIAGLAFSLVIMLRFAWRRMRNSEVKEGLTSSKILSVFDILAVVAFVPLGLSYGSGYAMSIYKYVCVVLGMVRKACSGFQLFRWFFDEELAEPEFAGFVEGTEQIARGLVDRIGVCSGCAQPAINNKMCVACIAAGVEVKETKIVCRSCGKRVQECLCRTRTNVFVENCCATFDCACPPLGDYGVRVEHVPALKKCIGDYLSAECLELAQEGSTRCSLCNTRIKMQVFPCQLNDCVLKVQHSHLNANGRKQIYKPRVNIGAVPVSTGAVHKALEGLGFQKEELSPMQSVFDYTKRNSWVVPVFMLSLITMMLALVRLNDVLRKRKQARVPEVKEAMVVVAETPVYVVPDIGEVTEPVSEVKEARKASNKKRTTKKKPRGWIEYDPVTGQKVTDLKTLEEIEKRLDADDLARAEEYAFDQEFDRENERRAQEEADRMMDQTSAKYAYGEREKEKKVTFKGPAEKPLFLCKHGHVLHDDARDDTCLLCMSHAEFLRREETDKKVKELLGKNKFSPLVETVERLPLVVKLDKKLDLNKVKVEFCKDSRCGGKCPLIHKATNKRKEKMIAQKLKKEGKAEIVDKDTELYQECVNLRTCYNYNKGKCRKSGCAYTHVQNSKVLDSKGMLNGKLYEVKEALVNGPQFYNIKDSVKSLGWSRSEGDERVHEMNCSKVWNGIEVSQHLFEEDSQKLVTFEFPGVEKVSYERGEGKVVAYDTLFFPLKGEQLKGVPSKQTSEPVLGQKCGLLTWNSYEDFQKGNYAFDTDVVKNLVINGDVQKAYAGYSSIGGNCGAMVLNPQGKVIGFHNFTSGNGNGFIPVTKSMVQKATQCVSAF